MIASVSGWVSGWVHWNKGDVRGMRLARCALTGGGDWSPCFVVPNADLHILRDLILTSPQHQTDNVSGQGEEGVPFFQLLCVLLRRLSVGTPVS